MRKLLYILLLFGSIVQAQFSPSIGVIASGVGAAPVSNAYTIDYATYDSKSLNTSAESSYAYNLAHGARSENKAYILVSTNMDEYTYTAGDISTGSATGNMTFVGAGTFRSFVWADSGTKGYAMDLSERCNQYSFSTAYDVDTDTAVRNHVITSETANNDDIMISADGTKFFLLAEETVWEYDLSTAYDISTETYSGENFVLGAEIGGLSNSWDWSPDGKTVMILDNGDETLHQYKLTVGWDVTTMSYDNVSLDVSARGSLVEGITWNEDGTILLIYDYGEDEIFQYLSN